MTLTDQELDVLEARLRTAAVGDAWRAADALRELRYKIIELDAVNNRLRISWREDTAAEKAKADELRGELDDYKRGVTEWGAKEYTARLKCKEFEIELSELRASQAALARDAGRYLAVIAHIRGGHYRGDLVEYIDSEFAGFNAIDEASHER